MRRKKSDQSRCANVVICLENALVHGWVNGCDCHFGSEARRLPRSWVCDKVDGGLASIMDSERQES